MITLEVVIVLHGEALDYGSRGSGLKTISLVNYLSQALGTGADNLLCNFKAELG